MEPEFPLALRLPGAGSRRLQRDLHEQLRAAIVDGRLRPGLRLPTTRGFARAYGVARNTALAVYDLLLGEGYVTTRGKGGTFVAAVAARPRSGAAAAGLARRFPNLRQWAHGADFARGEPAPPRLHFRLGVPDERQFPWPVWRRLVARAWRRKERGAPGYAEPQGLPALREAIARHASFARAVSCTADDVVVTAGAQQAFDLLARALVVPQRSVVAVENPGYPPACDAFAAAGARLARVPVDAEGLVVARIPDAARVVYVTPSHQFPLGVAMSARRRAELLAFARRRRAVVIEDDYDGEFRFGGRPLDALQTLDRDARVFYVGTFSKSLFPDLRLGFVIAPAWARAGLVGIKSGADVHCPVVTQDALAAFIGEGHLLRHVRRMHRVYATRRERLLEGLAGCAGRLELQPGIAGLHVAALARGGLDVPALLQRAAMDGVGLNALRRYHAGRITRDGLVFGYGVSDAAAIVEGMVRLRRLLRAGVRG